ncbi:Transmembrane protein, partial [Stegodyphus mimosarum]
MATPASTPRTPFKFDISNLLPEGHEKALKQAFYNVAATVFVVFVSAACVAVYYVLEPFLRPLLWAVLFGSVLHPFKHGMTVVLKRWLQSLQVSGTPLTVGALTSPFFVVDHISEQMWNFTMQYALLFITIVGCVSVSFLIYSCVPDFMTLFFYNMLSRLLNGASMLLEFCHGAALFVWTVVVGYIIILSVWWTPNTRPYLIYLSPIVWTILICHLVSIAGSLRLTILLTLVALMVIGFLADIKGRYSDSATAAITVEQSNEEESHALTPMQAIRSGLAWLRGTEESCS